MGRSPCCEKLGLKKGPWTPEEDQKLLAYIEKHGHGSWRALPAKAGLQRCGKSCRLRWTNYLRPDIKRGKFSLQEQQTIIQLHALLGNRWSAIANHLPKRTDNEIKNYWNTHLKKRLTKMGIDPVTHKPRTDGFGSHQSKDVANLSHMAQWESARLEAEARLVRETKQLQGSSHNTIVTTYHQSLHAHHISRLLINNRISTQPNDQPPAPPCLDVLKAWQGSFCNTLSKTNGMIYPMMFATDDLESPTSTLSFCDNILPVPTSCKFGWMNQGSLIPAIANVGSTCTSTAAGNVSCEPATARGSKTRNGTDGIIQEYCDERCDNIASWSTEPNANNDGNDAIIIDKNGMIMADYSVEGSSWQVEAAVNESTVPADRNERVSKMEAPYFGELINLEHEDHNYMMVYKDERFAGNDWNSLENSNVLVTNYWNSILNLVNASPSSNF